MAKESHYSSKKDRVFVRGIQGQYSLKEELARLRGLPRVINGKGYEIHDGVRYDWSAGDVAIVHMNCVHQHFNADPVKPARALVMKPKPMILFMNLMFQQTVIPRPKDPTPEGAGFVPRHFEENYNH